MAIDVRFLTIHLLYTDDVPKYYNPPGFNTSKDNVMFVPDDELWRMSEQKLGQMDAGFHRYSILQRMVVHSLKRLVLVLK